MERRIVIEPFCGMAGLSFYLMGGKPPISWMGSKVGYAEPLAAILGLSRSNVAGFVWGDVGPNVAALAHLCGATGATAEDVAGWMWSTGHCDFSQPPRLAAPYVRPEGNPDGSWKAPPRDWLATRIDSLPLPNKTAVATLIRSWKDEEPRALWERLKAKGWPSLLLPEGSTGRWLGPASVEDVAGWLTASLCSYKSNPESGYNAGNMEHGTKPSGAHHYPVTLAGFQKSVESLPTFPPIACWQGRAEDLMLPADLSGMVAYLDPPYKGDEATGGRKITGYKHGDCPRESVLAMARDYDKRGAIVAISESVRLDRELGDGWHAVQIDHARRGQKRTFSVQSEEWVTMNRPPQYIPPKQYALWGASGR